jgi:hypothetical protein
MSTIIKLLIALYYLKIKKPPKKEGLKTQMMKKIHTVQRYHFFKVNQKNAPQKNCGTHNHLIICIKSLVYAKDNPTGITNTSLVYQQIIKKNLTFSRYNIVSSVRDHSCNSQIRICDPFF